MKRLWKMIMVVCGLLLALQFGNMAIPANALVSGYYSYSIFGGTATITDVNTNIYGSVTIPSTLGGYAVTAIDDNAFSHCKSITKVTIPESVTEIGEQAFAFCDRLESVNIPKNVSTIGASTFARCNELETVYFNAADCTIRGIEYMAPFIDCNSLEQVILGNSVRKIGQYMFYRCENVKELTIPEGVTEIGKWAFFGCNGLTSVTYNAVDCTIGERWIEGCDDVTTVKIGSKVKILPASIFSGWSNVEEITIPSSVSEIGDKAFYYFDTLKKITMPNTVTELGEEVFHGCSALKTVKLSNKIKRIGERTFYGCKELESIVIPDSVTEIASSAFSQCGHLKGINIPASIKEIESGAFYECTRLEKVDIADIGKWCEAEIEGYSACPFYYGAKLYSNGRSLTTVVIPKTVSRVSAYTFYNAKYITNIVLSNSVKVVDDDAFRNLTSLESVYFIGTQHEWEMLDLGYDFTRKTTIFSKAAITKQPSAVSAAENTQAKFSVTANGHGLKYQWQVKTSSTGSWANSTVTGYNTKTITVSAINANNGRQYRCVVTDLLGNKAISSAAKLSIVPKITKQPVSTKGKVNATSKFSVAATGTGLKYQWQVKTSTSEAWKNSTFSGYNKTTLTVPATMARNGYQFRCKVTNKNGNTAYTSIVKLTVTPIDISTCSIKLSATSYTYNGAMRAPSVTVKNAGGTTLTKNTHYTVTYATGRKNVGTYKVTIKMKGNYTGTKTLTFKINPVKTTVSKVTPATKSLKVTLTKKSTQVTGYQIQYSTSKSFKTVKTANISSYKTTSTTIKSLKAKTTYYVRVRTYKTVSGVKYYSGWSTVKSAKTK